MSLYLLDTDTLTLVRHHTPTVLTAISNATTAGHAVGITVISVEEQIDGWYKAIRTARTRPQMAQAYRSLAETVPVWARFPIVPMTESAINRFEQLVRLKLNIGRMDLRIAATALDAGATVVTHNVRDFQRVPGLAVEDWATVPTAGL